MVNWTREQEEAIYTEGNDILVSAAAGSGKTAVLVERIIQKLLSDTNPVDIDSLLVVTFTNAAAQEMRTRVGLALESALEQDPTSNHLRKQLSLLQSASISTLHSFCKDVIKQYAYLLDIDPAFRIANEMEIDLIKQDILDDLFEDWYGKSGEEQAAFFSVVDRFSSDRSDIDVESLILTLHTFAIQNPWPEHWLDQLADAYVIPDKWVEADLSWLSIIKQEVNNQFQAIEQEMMLARNIAEQSDGPYHYLEAIEADEENLQKALSHLNSWTDLQTFMSASSFKRLSSKRVDCNEDKKEKVRNIRNQYRKRWNDMADDWFSRDLPSYVSDMRELAPIIKQLVQLVKEFNSRFMNHKEGQALVDFSDLEHYCLQLLLDESSTVNNAVPSDVAKHYRRQFTELLIDEYQDTNLVQETILMLISNQQSTGNRFMVGDVKQSIYRFRHAEPSLFIEKYNKFSQEDQPAKRIDLVSNFRSREGVLTGVNYIFRQILNEELGEINYDKYAELTYGNKTYDEAPIEHPNPELIIIDREAKEDNEASSKGENYEDLENAQLEARVYAKKIKEWIGEKDGRPLQVVDKSSGKQRDFQYRDTVILLRSMTWAPTIVDELKKQGIPVYAELSTGYFEAIEIKIILSYLKVIDNPKQDIPLASVLRSPIINLNEEELASIRLVDKNSTFFDALKQFAQQGEGETVIKVEAFLKQLNQFRFASRQGALSELIWEIYRKTGFYDFVGGMPGGRQRQANLRALYDRARGYESTSFRGLFRFLRFIERMEERGDDLGAARALSEQEDVVRIMTIHKSKGLEFPTVILGGVDRQFNLQDLNQRYLLHKDYGFASKYIDPIKRITYPTLFYHALKQEIRRDLLSEEMRVLYVAMTRAKEKLTMVGNVRSFEKKKENWQEILDYKEWVLPTHYRAESRTYLDWIGAALIRHQSSHILRDEEDQLHLRETIQADASNWDISVIHGSELVNSGEDIREESSLIEKNITKWKQLSLEDKELEETVFERLAYIYPFAEAAETRAKQSVTEIKRQRELLDEYSSNDLLTSSQMPIIDRPKFMQKEKKLSATEIGTIMHTVMQHLPFEKTLDKLEIKSYLNLFIEQEIITEEEKQVIDINAIEQFYKTNIALYMQQEQNIYREVPFSLTLPASEVYATWSSEMDERVLIQGVIDCVIRKGDGWIILDYKTDSIPTEVTEEVKQKLIERYEIQMGLYRHAIETIWQEPVVETYLYFFSKQLLVNVPV